MTTTPPTPVTAARAATTITIKRYACNRCGHVERQSTNHHGSTWSWGRINTCPVCPPWAKYSEFGGRTVWTCLDRADGKPLRVVGDVAIGVSFRADDSTTDSTDSTD